jgi:transcriptional regulator with XRE-family HTH domain
MRAFLFQILLDTYYSLLLHILLMKINTYKIERARLLKGWSKTTLAEKAKVDPCTVGRVERGKNLKPETVKRIADVLGLDMSDLLIDSNAA